MRIKIDRKFEITKISIKKYEGEKHQNLLAFASLRFEDKEYREYFTISGFTTWKSNYEGLNVEPPKKKNFTYCLFEKSLWQKIEKAIIEEYEYLDIPVVE